MKKSHLFFRILIACIFGIMFSMILSCNGEDPLPDVLVFNLQRVIIKNVDDAAGRWQFTGGKVLQSGNHVGNYTCVKRVVMNVTSQQNTATVALTIFFLGEKPPQNIVMHGSHDFNSGGQIGSVSAASKTYDQYIGAGFSVVSNLLTITP